MTSVATGHERICLQNYCHNAIYLLHAGNLIHFNGIPVAMSLTFSVFQMNVTDHESHMYKYSVNIITVKPPNKGLFGDHINSAVV